MRHLAPLSLMLAALAAPASVQAGDAPYDVAALKARSSALADRYQGALLSQLMAAMKEGGPEAAVAVCAEAAPAIAAELSAESGAHVARTAQRVRNPASAPTEAEQRILASMASAPLDAEGEPAEATWMEGEGKDATLHYMRAIPLKPPCAACHGENVNPALLATIKEHYPGDTATGFKPGDLRGAFTITWPVDGLE